MLLCWGAVSTLPNPQAGRPPLSAVHDCLFNILAATRHIWRPFFQPQPEDMPCRGDRDPLITVPRRGDGPTYHGATPCWQGPTYHGAMPLWQGPTYHGAVPWWQGPTYHGVMPWWQGPTYHGSMMWWRRPIYHFYCIINYFCWLQPKRTYRRHRGGSVCVYSSTVSLSSALYGGWWLTPRLGCFTPRKQTHYSLYRRLGEPQGQSGQVRKMSPPPGFDSQTVRSLASCYTDWTIPVW